MSNYTKVNIRKDLNEQLKVKAAADNRSLTNYLEQLIIKDLTTPNQMKDEGNGK